MVILGTVSAISLGAVVAEFLALRARGRLEPALAAPVSVVGRAALVAGGATYAAGAQLFGWKGKEP